MKAKKLIALLTAVTMIVIPTSTAFAEGLTGASVSSDATINYIDPSTVINLVVPTNASMAFTLDPQNLAAIQGVGGWNPSGGGTILPVSVVSVVNKSAIPVKTTFAFSVTDDATTDTTLLEDATDINVGTDRKMHLTVTPANAKTSIAATEIATGPAIFVKSTTGSAIVFTTAELTAAGVTEANMLATSGAAITATFGQFVPVDEAVTPKSYKQVEVPTITDVIPATTATTVLEYNATTDGLATTNADAIATVTASGAAISYIVGKAAYYVSKTDTGYELVYKDQNTNTNYDTSSFVIGGSLNKNANWSVYTGETGIALSATYSFKAMTDTEAGLVTELLQTHNSIAYVAPEVPTIGTASYAMTAATVVDVAVDLGAGDSAATGITSITYDDGSLQTLDPSKYSFASNTLTFTSAYVDELIAASVTTRAYTVTFNDTVPTTATVTLTYTAPIDPVAPSIETTEYALTAATAVEVTVALGAGSSAADGITSITYNDGADQTLDPSKYSFASNTLTFTSAYVDELIAASVTTRAYTVTFNDTVPTTATVTLTYTSPDVAASVTPATVTFSKATGATVAVNLGSGTGLATGTTAGTTVATVVNDVDYAWTAGTWSLSGTTLTLSSTASINALAVDQTRTIKVTFSTGATDTFIVTIAN